MINGSIPRRYARALLAIGVDAGQFEPLGSELERFAALMVHKDLREILENPSVAQSQRKRLMEALIGRLQASPTMRSFLLLLTDRNRTEYLPAIAREYRVMADEHAGRIRADVVSATPLDGESVARLKRSLEQKTGKQIILEQSANPELIAGMVTKIGSIIYDGSIKTRLEQMRQALLEGEL